MTNKTRLGIDRRVRQRQTKLDKEIGESVTDKTGKESHTVTDKTKRGIDKRVRHRQAKLDRKIDRRVRQ